MITGIDHIVIAARDLEQVAEAYRQLGFTVVEGGRHPYGSYNALIAFADDSYIELISFYEPSPAHPWWGLLHERGGGLIDFCMATDDIRGDLEILRANGVDCGELSEGGRERPDGYQVRWINNKVGGAWQGLIPFLIEDVTPREERLPGEREHANGATGIHRLRLMSDDVAGAAAVMAALMGEVQASADGIGFEVGGQRIDYVAGPERGPFSVSFKTSGEPQRIDPAEAGGARISLVV